MKIGEISKSSMIYNRLFSLEWISSLVNVSTYIREIRLNYAIKLIESGEVNVDTIGIECGFNSASYFSVCFKNYTGLSPKKYINQKIQLK